MVDEQRIRAALAEVIDPEMGENIVDLGMVGEIRIGPASVVVTLIPTSATCPMGSLLQEDAIDALRRTCPHEWSVEVELDWDTPWSAERLSPALKEQFGW